ncbi:MAG: RNA-binding protein [Streptosporangiales bacterium]|nr:RNA-binding protein [Streptosporangiales bacterium]
MDREGETPVAGDERERLDRPLPEAVRQRLVDLGARRLGALPPEEVPAPLRRIARFEPRRRARLAATQIAAHLERDKAFREQVAEEVREAEPELAEAVEAEVVPPAAEPVAVAAAAYLLRPPGWVGLVEAACAQVEKMTSAADEKAASRTVAQLRDQVAAAKAAGREEIERLRDELRRARGEAADLRRKLHEARERARRSEHRAEELRVAAEEQRAVADAAVSSAEAELRRLRGRLADAEAQTEALRRSAREARTVDDARLRVLLDSLLDAAQGLRRELALPSTISRPADMVPAIEPDRPGPRSVPGRALADDDPELLDHLLALPQVHLLVDGYNVTKTGYPNLTLEDQRARLLTGLGGLAAQTRAEITCVFDGAELGAPVSVPAPRGVRVLFSEPEETADELIRRLVAAEPPGRAVVVVSSDREVAEGVRRAGARPTPAALLLRRLGRS